MAKDALSRKAFSGGFNDFVALRPSKQEKLSKKLGTQIGLFSGNQQILVMNNYYSDQSHLPKIKKNGALSASKNK
jgi:hypothetical protein